MLYGYPPSGIPELDRPAVQAYQRLRALYEMDEQLELLSMIGGQGWQPEISRLRRAGAVHHESRAEHSPEYARLHRAMIAWQEHPGQTAEEWEAGAEARQRKAEAQALREHMRQEKKSEGVQVLDPTFFAS